MNGRVIVHRCNAVRKRIPFAYWLAYDAVTAPFLLWGLWSVSPWFLAPLAMLLFAAFFDVTEAIVKWSGAVERTQGGKNLCTACGMDLTPTPEQIEALRRWGNPLRRQPCLETESGLHTVAAVERTQE